MKLNNEVRVRFAPSPTGPLHIGGARTALFNWLFAKKLKNHGGKFILRLEDTDIERSKKEFEKDILESLRWLGLDYDEGPDIGGNFGPYRQSEKTEIYKKYLEKLLAESKAYYCFCSKEELDKEREEMMAKDLAPKYSGKCRKYSIEEFQNKIKAGERGVIRFKTPEQEIEFEDLIRGNVKFNAGLMGDIVIAKSLTEPLYNFAVAVDDYDMKISHVIRGEDHLPNTPKQILIQEALGFHHPQYAHLPLILDKSKKKMSKRNLDTSLKDYRDNGYLKEAIVNFIALLGWHPQDDREVLSAEELIDEFDIKRVQKSGAVFDVEKLDWLNGQYIKNLNLEKLAELIKNFIPEKWRVDESILMGAVAAEKERIKKLSDFKELADFFFELSDYNKDLLIWKNMNFDGIADNLNLLKSELEKINEKEFDKERLEAVIAPLTEKYGKGELLWPLRAALSGKKASPGPFEIMDILKKAETLRRIDTALFKLK
ncbi:glutamate--tRNA ligase [Candidatus Wolfebacteria bacterium]|nr:glutamate--tRNA ligase [Candidatus Wolfebacteria bacterium]